MGQLEPSNKIIFLRLFTDLTHCFKTEPDITVQIRLIECIQRFIQYSHDYLLAFYANKIYTTIKENFNAMPIIERFYPAKHGYILFMDFIVKKELSIFTGKSGNDFAHREFDLKGFCHGLKAYHPVSNGNAVDHLLKELNKMDSFLDTGHTDCTMDKVI